MATEVENKHFTKIRGNKLFLSLAALYNAFPSSRKDLAELYNSNTVLPINLIEEYIGSRNLKIIQVSSYFQLLGLEFQTPYSLQKAWVILIWRKIITKSLSFTYSILLAHKMIVIRLLILL